MTEDKRIRTEVVLLLNQEQSSLTVRKALAGAEVSFVSAVGPADALRYLLQTSIHVLILDLRTPAIDIWQFIKEATDIAPWVSILAIAHSPTREEASLASRNGIGLLADDTLNDGPLSAWMAEQKVIPPASATASGETVQQLADTLRAIATLGHKAINTTTLGGALHEIGTDLSQIVNCDLLGLLAVDEREHVMQFVDHRGVSSAFIDQMRSRMLAQYRALGNEPLSPETLRINILAPDHSSAHDGAGSIHCVPIISGHRTQGILAFGYADARQLEPAHRFLMCHVAGQVACLYSVLKGMRKLATHDPLTNVLNRVGLEDALERNWLISRRYNWSMGVIVIDIDYFKTLNDSYGHSVGDQVLYEFSRVIERVARVSDIVARFGGDEFVAILPKANEDDARAFGERLLAHTRSHVFCEQAHQLSLTVSVGIATSMNPTAPATSAAVLSQADRALYMAKRAGRDRLCLWPGQTSTPAVVSESDKTNDLHVAPFELEGRIMLVDDESAVRRIITMILEREGYKVSAFGSTTDAITGLRSAAEKHYDILLTDISMPGKNGIELLKEVDEHDESIVKIVMTGYATVDNAVSSLREGAYDFIQKPVDRMQVLTVVKRAMEYRRLYLENARYQARLEDLVRKRSAQLAASLEEIKKSHEFTLEAMVAMLDARERQTGQHSLLVRELAAILGRNMGLKANDLEVLAHGALLHDIGKISVPDGILLKPGKLTQDEWAIMRTHPEVGYRILANSPYLKDVAEIVLQHHEHYDGTGYPRGIKGSDICLGARIFAVIDAYEAMRSARVYHSTLSAEEAMEEIRRCRGTQFDPNVADVFLECQPEIEEFWNTHSL